MNDRFFWLLLLIAPMNQAIAYTFIDVGIDSNILVRDNRVIFKQGTGSLTMLDLETGQVLKRVPRSAETASIRQIYECDSGIVATTRDGLIWLDDQTLTVERSIRTGRGYRSHTHVAGDRVTIGGSYRVTQFDMSTGQRRWSVPADGIGYLAATNNRVLVASDGSDQGVALIWLDADTGETVGQRVVEDVVKVWLDGARAFLFVQESRDGFLDISRAGIQFVEVYEDGKQIQTVDLSSADAESKGYRTTEEGFYFEDRFHSYRGDVRDVFPFEYEEWFKNADHESVKVIPLAVGALVQHFDHDRDGQFGVVLHLYNKQTIWAGLATQLKRPVYPERVTVSDGNLVFASGTGAIECLDLETGQPRWLYVFPMTRQTVSFSTPNGLPPTLTEMAARYDAKLKSLKSVTGTFLITDFDRFDFSWDEVRMDRSYAGRVIIDPSPDNPFKFVRQWIYKAAGCAVVPIAIQSIVLPLWIWRRRRWQPKRVHYRLFAMMSLWLALLPLFGLFRYGRVDPLVTKCLWGVLLLMLVLAVGSLLLQKRGSVVVEPEQT